MRFSAVAASKVFSIAISVVPSAVSRRDHLSNVVGKEKGRFLSGDIRSDSAVDFGGQVDQAFAGLNAGGCTDFIEHCVQFGGAGGGDLND